MQSVSINVPLQRNIKCEFQPISLLLASGNLAHVVLNLACHQPHSQGLRAKVATFHCIKASEASFMSSVKDDHVCESRSAETPKSKAKIRNGDGPLRSHLISL